mgnify:CR=1 FL=1
MIANGAAVQPGYEEVGTQGFGNTYEEPQAIVTVEAGNRLSNGLTPNGKSPNLTTFFLSGKQTVCRHRQSALHYCLCLSLTSFESMVR